MTRFAFLFSLFVFLAVETAGQTAAAVDAKPGPSTAPMTVGIVVDNSGSYRAVLEKVINAVNALIDDLRPDDESFLLTFVSTDKINLRQEMTKDKRELRDAVENMYTEGGQTSILDAVVFASKYMLKNAAADAGRSRVLVLITDGENRVNAASVDDAVNTAKAAGLRIFVLGIHDEEFFAKVVDRLTRETGGAKFVPKTPKDIPSAIANLLTAIRGK